MSDQSFQPTQDPQNYALRPLNKGMILNFSSLVIPEEACRVAENFIVEERGPRRRDGTQDFSGETPIPYRFADAVTYWTTDGTQVSIAITDGPLYKVGFLGPLDPVIWNYTGTGDGTGSTFTDASSDFNAEGVLPGDFLEVDTDLVRITSVPADDTITLLSDLSQTYTGESYTIWFSLRNDQEYRTDWAFILNEVVFTDYKRELLTYDVDTETLVPYLSASDKPEDDLSQPIDFVAATIVSFLDRLWVGHVKETDSVGTVTDYRQRIRWSIPTDPRNFSRVTNFIDLPYTSGSIRKMERFGDGLAVYCKDAIFIGTRTNNPDLPVAFQQLDTGGIGLIGQKAMTPWLDGHFFVGQDDIYFLSNSGLERLGAPILRETIKKCDYPDYIYVQPDPTNERIIFGFPESAPRLAKLWSFHYKARAWSYDAVETDFISNPDINFTLQWADLTGTWANLENTYPTWADMNIEEASRTLYFEANSQIQRFVPGAANDSGQPIRVVYETKDYDLNKPDTNKTWLRIGLKIDYEVTPTVPIRFTVSISANRGRRWVDAGTLTIRPGEDEGYTSFLMTSSSIRFRLISDSDVTPYWLSEIVMRFRARGREITEGTQSNVPNTQG